ncbi:AraC family transcriptional regulator [Streptomyces sp. NPDC093594]|uniref:helix-turn-helix transcriptional regulator n=1 Tax=Streptomyces sp. NPDC093594 TaxID=3155305 RepID=UPI00344C6191
MCRPALRQALIAAHRLRELAVLRRVRDRIDREYTRPLDVAALAREAGWPAGQLDRRFRDAYGLSLHAWVTVRRVEGAMALLRRGDVTPAQAARAVGCASAAVFRARFTALAGMTPEAYRERAAVLATGLPWCVTGGFEQE